MRLLSWLSTTILWHWATILLILRGSSCSRSLAVSNKTLVSAVSCPWEIVPSTRVAHSWPVGCRVYRWCHLILHSKRRRRRTKTKWRTEKWAADELYPSSRYKTSALCLYSRQFTLPISDLIVHHPCFNDHFCMTLFSNPEISPYYCTSVWGGPGSNLLCRHQHFCPVCDAPVHSPV